MIFLTNFLSIFFFLILVLATNAELPKVSVQSEMFDIQSFQTGDIIMWSGRYLKQIHPGHIGIVVKLPIYHQLCILDHDNSRQSFLLKPICSFFSKYRYYNNLFVLHMSDPTLTYTDVRAATQNIKQVSYNYNGVFDYINILLNKYMCLPHVPQINIFPKNQKNQMFCTQFVYSILVHCRVLHSSILNTNYDVMIPKNLINGQCNLNQYTMKPHCYKSVRKIVWSTKF
jgi:hypothetical protein